MELLQPFIVTSWHGHRDEKNIPAAVQSVWQEKFTPRRGSPLRTQSNVDLAVLDSRGRVRHAFDGFLHESTPHREPLAQYTARELRFAREQLDRRELAERKNPLKLPDLGSSRGMRVFVRLMDDRMTAYQAPVVETMRLAAKDWEPLAWPDESRTVTADHLAKWLSEVYPPGVMERTDPRTKRAYRVESVEGNLSLVPSGSDAARRYARLEGKVRLTDDGGDDFSYEGQLEVVLGYDRGGKQVSSLRGVFDGRYPRTDRRENRVRWIPLQATFESLPEQVTE